MNIFNVYISSTLTSLQRLYLINQTVPNQILTKDDINMDADAESVWESEDDNSPIDERLSFDPMEEFSDEMKKEARRVVRELDDTTIPNDLLRMFASLIACHIYANGQRGPQQINRATIQKGIDMIRNGGWTPQVRPTRPMPLKKLESRHRVRVGRILKDCPVSLEKLKNWRKRKDTAIQRGIIIPPKPRTPAHRKAGSDVYLRVTRGAPKLYTHQFIDRQGQIVPPANVAEELNVTDIMVELAVANDDEELRRVTAYNLEMWTHVVRTRLYIVAGGTNGEEDKLNFVIPDVKAPNMLAFAKAISRRLDNLSDYRQSPPARDMTNRTGDLIILDEGDATDQRDDGEIVTEDTDDGNQRIASEQIDDGDLGVAEQGDDGDQGITTELGDNRNDQNQQVIDTHVRDDTQGRDDTHSRDDSPSDTLNNSSPATVEDNDGVNNAEIKSERLIHRTLPIIDLTSEQETADTNIDSEQTIKTEVDVTAPVIDLTDDKPIKREAAYDMTISWNENRRKVVKLEALDISEAISLLENLAKKGD
ncbi:hypothetical protein DTO027B9_6526 [Paecilomyces variotii]|nr:hypothetical protein DTO027B9_6526 [Paecilomyces variotii]